MGLYRARKSEVSGAERKIMFLPEGTDTAQDTARVAKGLWPDFLIDLTGSLVPGVIFLFSITAGFIIPLFMIYFVCRSTPMIVMDSTITMFGTGFWLIVFFVFLILAYAIGSVLCRLDINDVDKKSYKVQKKKLYKEKLEEKIEHTDKGKLRRKVCSYLKREICNPFFKVRSKIFDENYQERSFCFFCGIDKNLKANFCCDYIQRLCFHLTEEGKRSQYSHSDTLKKLENMKKDIKNATEKRLRNIINCANNFAYRLYQKQKGDLLDFKLEDILLEYEQADVVQSQDAKTQRKILSSFMKSCIEIDETLSDESLRVAEFLAIGWYFLYYLREEMACGEEKDCQFPYRDYDIYLSKRGLGELYDHAKWCKTEGERTKNRINFLKVEIQMMAKSHYNIIVKNEAHIRMASSSYSVANQLCYRILPIFTVILLVLAPLCLINFNDASPFWPIDSRSRSLIVVGVLGLPIGIWWLNLGILRSVAKFIHYQRLREILFVLKVYHELTSRQPKGRIIWPADS